MVAKKRKGRTPTRSGNGTTSNNNRMAWVLCAAVAIGGSFLLLKPRNKPTEATAASPAMKLYHKGMQSIYENHVQQSLVYFDECIAMDPTMMDCYNSKAGAQRMLGQAQGALSTLKRGGEAISNPNHLATLYSSTFLLLKDLQQPQEAVEYIQKSIALQPTAVRYSNWATVVKDHAKQVELYTKALELDPNYFSAFCSRVNSYYFLAEWELIDRDYEQLLKYQQALIDEDANQVNTNSTTCLLPYYTTYMVISPQLMKDTAIQYAKRQATMSKEGVLRPLQPRPLRNAEGRMIRKLRIGYVSSDFSIHPVGRNVLGLFMAHDKTRCDIFAFSTKRHENDAITQTIKEHVTYVDISTIHDYAQAARLIRYDYQIDVLVDLNGWTEGHRLRLFSARPAPVQITHGLGFVGTVGAEAFDYFVSDHVATPKRFDDYYTEKVIRLPRAYLPASHATVHLTKQGSQYNPATCNKTQVGIDNGLPLDKFVFCNFQGLHRIGRESFETWLRILRNTPNSILWMAIPQQELRDKLLSRAHEYGLDNATDRIIFGGHVNPGLHLIRAQACDLHLDSWPYTAHSTGVDVLFAGVPLLSFLSDYHDKQSPNQVPKMASRVSASLLDTLGMSELVASSIDEYEQKAVHYATNRVAYTKLRNELLSKRLSSPLFDLRSYARVHEDAYLQAFQRYLEGRELEPIDVGPPGKREPEPVNPDERNEL